MLGDYQAMKVLHAFNRHRGGGGSDNAWDETIKLSETRGLEVGVFSRDSRQLANGVTGRIKAFYSGIYSRDSVKAFRQALSDFRPDVVHAHELFPFISPWILPECSRAEVPVVFTCYDYRLTCPVATHFQQGNVCNSCLGGREYWAVLKNCRDNYAESLAYGLRNAVLRKFRLVTGHVSQFIVLTDFSRDWLINELSVESNRITVNPCVIDLPEEQVDPAKGSYVAFAGRFVEEKGVELLIAAVRKAGLPLKLAGNSTSHPAVQAGDPVECVLTPSRQALADFYRSARILVVPSIWYETFGIVAAEAMSHGVPVVASRFGALQYTIKDGVSGLLFEKQNIEDLVSKLTKLWHSPELCRSLGAEGRRRVKEHFNQNIHFERLTDAYKKARQAPVFGVAEQRKKLLGSSL